MPSPYRQPTELKAQKGTLRKSRETPEAMVAATLSEVPTAPEGLPERAVQEWYNVCTQLQLLGVLSSMDLSTLKAYCYQVYLLDLAQGKLETEGHTIMMENKGGGKYPVKSPWVGIYNEALTHVSRIGQMFGFSPSARTKISLLQAKEKKNDPWDEI